MQRPSPRFRAEEYFAYEISEEMIYPNLWTPFLVFFSFLDSTISGHVTQIFDVLRLRKIKVIDFSEVAKFWKVLLNIHKVIIIIRF